MIIVVKGDGTSVFKEFQRRGIPFEEFKTINPKEPNTVVTTSIEYWSMVADWFSESNTLRPPYPNLSCLFYTRKIE